ncbi:primosomal protein N' [Dictyobacter arantiisoli]|uniref:Replication restart protein PriA n=1 Tax=Dictyobacter arantiisoli TaxID=2014874 RepID=A0A5A5TCP5_9CHLR|nr:primosomal protein N' [Dictyobacter arantiisoli]GCF09290.1 primosomal protein N' [Dictyobacter arantiisoli]
MLADVLTSAASWLGERSMLTYVVPEELVAELQVGQLVAVPYGERLVEGIVWTTSLDEWVELEPGDELRPLHTILDPLPALQPYQMALAQWLADYYVTPLAYVAQMMLPPGLMQRSRAVLRLADHDGKMLDTALQEGSLQLRALIGLLLSEGSIDVERVKELLGPKQAKAVLKEARSHELFLQNSELDAPRAKARFKRVVRLLAKDTVLDEWRARMTILAERNAPLAPVQIIPDHIMRPRSRGKKDAQKTLVNPWASPEAVSATATLELGKRDKESLRAQHQLAAVDLLLHNSDEQVHWSANALCKASGMTQAQLQQLVKEQILVLEEIEVRRDPLASRALALGTTPLELTPDQQHAVNCIVGDEYDGRPILLHGITGSGKTEVYLQALAAIIEQGQQGIILVPEIALTTQAVLRVAGRFPERVAIIHSELSIGERYDEWRRIRSGEVDVVIGSRSALFAPLPNPGLIIIDEEHEAAYKQGERRPTYHARHAALMLGEILHIPIVLGSATPALESFYRARQGIYHLVELRGRINASLPPVEVVDLRNELHAGNTSIISRRLQEELTQVLERQQQAILFLNRRGAASCILCRDCGYTVMCDRCDIPMTYHSTEHILLCHYCGRQNKVVQFCPQCKSSGIRYFGLGTEKIQETIQRLFPQARLLRWDRDTARNRRAHEQLLDSFANREADILIGTQMIAKGLDLPGVTLVGVVSADIALALPDYATTERTFTLLTQVAGRAGRGTEAGKVIIQTFNPQHFSIETASHHDYHSFYELEIASRQLYRYPPFRHFVKFTYSHENQQRSKNEAIQLYEQLHQWIERLGLEDTDIVGPAPALMERVRNKYRWQLIARGPDLHRLLRVIDAPDWEIDIDPVSTL